MSEYSEILQSFFDKLYKAHDEAMSVKFDYDHTSGYWYEIEEELQKLPTSENVNRDAEDQKWCMHLETAIYDSGFRRLKYCKICNADLGEVD